MKQPSKERGCTNKANLGSKYIKQADKLSIKHNKSYGVYRCPHCNGTHLTTKLGNAARYKELLYRTGRVESMTIRRDLKTTIRLIRLNRNRGLKQAVIDMEDKVSALFSLRERVQIQQQ